MNSRLEQFLKEHGYTVEYIDQLPTPKHWWEAPEPLQLHKKTIKVLQPQAYQDYKIAQRLTERMQTKYMIALLLSSFPILGIASYAPAGPTATAIAIAFAGAFLLIFFKITFKAQIQALRLLQENKQP